MHDHLGTESLAGELGRRSGGGRPYGIDTGLLQFWRDALTNADFEAILRDTVERAATVSRSGSKHRVDWLMLSGGGPDGAFRAGILAGWQSRGDRPDFRLVTGVSTGAILALFTFLGPEHDAMVKDLYTS